MSKPLRRSQAIAPFGIGALVDFTGPVSLIHAGLDAWPYDASLPSHREFEVRDEPRLARRVGVDYFVQPPDYRRPERGRDNTQPNLDLKLPFLRFPLWHSCPRCGRMHLAKYHAQEAPKCVGPIGSGSAKGESHKSRKMVQVRFVAACKHGHLRDFPWVEWLFGSANPEWRPDGSGKWLRLRSTGSASLGGVEVAAEELAADHTIRVVEKRTLVGAFAGDPSSNAPSAFNKVGLTCTGDNPVLAIGAGGVPRAPHCGEQLYALLRGASNLYFPQTVSSIYIPEVNDSRLSQDILDLLDDYQVRKDLTAVAMGSENGLVTIRNAKTVLSRLHPESLVAPEGLAEAANAHILKDVLLDNRKARAFLQQKFKIDGSMREEVVRKVIENTCPDWAIDPALLVKPLTEFLSGHADDQDDDAAPRQDSLAEGDFRHQEYRVFNRDVQEGTPKTNLLIRSVPIGEYAAAVSGIFERVALLHKLRETRAYVGFSRIFSETDLPPERRWTLISSQRKNWLPAIVVRGEGIFLKLDEARLGAWARANTAIHARRLEAVNRNVNEMRSRRKQREMIIIPEFVVLHTLAHVLINQLVYDCGYSSAALRERIYFSADENKRMAGILIYTAAGDSEGTMGGLVQMGRPGRMEPLLLRALEKARWCSTDPVCIESKGQGPDNCNLAACHSCGLLPETSCEEQNRILDRGVLVGTLDHPESGFFSQVSTE